MPYIDDPKPHKCELPTIFPLGIESRQPKPIGQRWYCEECLSIWKLFDDQRDGPYWRDTREKFKSWK